MCADLLVKLSSVTTWAKSCDWSSCGVSDPGECWDARHWFTLGCFFYMGFPRHLFEPRNLSVRSLWAGKTSAGQCWEGLEWSRPGIVSGAAQCILARHSSSQGLPGAGIFCHTITQYAKVERTQKDCQVKLLAPRRTAPGVTLRALSQFLLSSVRCPFFLFL